MRQRFTVHGILKRRLSTHEQTGEAVIVVGAITLYVPAMLLPTLDTFTCGETIEVECNGDKAVALRKG